MLRFHLFGMPVTVRTSFLIIAALIGFTGVGNPERTVGFIVIVFVSILVHELGHAVTARTFGSEVAIELNGLGGLTRWNLPGGEITPGRRALIAAAGSATGLAFGGLVWIVANQFGPYDAFSVFILNTTIYVNVFWGLLNWLPIRPLDGGHLLESLLEKIAPERGEVIAKVIFIVTTAGALVFAVTQRFMFIAILAGWMLLSEFSTSQQVEQPSGIPTLSYDEPGGEVERSVDEVPPTSSPESSDG